MTYVNLVISIVIIVLVIIYWYNMHKISYRKEYDQIFSSIESYPEIKLLEQNWKIIRDEMPSFDINNLNKNLTRNIGVWDTDLNKNILNELNNKVDWVTGWSPGWFHFPIVYLGKPIDGIEKILPKTVEIIKKIPSIYVAGFSVLSPNTTLGWHVDETGSDTNSLAVNLGLDSNNSTLYVKNSNGSISNTSQKNGHAIIFDSNYEHQVINHDTNYRVILYVDFKVNQVGGTIVKGYGDAKKLGFPTVNMKLHKNIQCGLYTAMCVYGDCIVAIDKSQSYAEVHLKQFNPDIDEDTYLYLKELHKINPKSDNGIIGNYYRGC